MLQSTVVPVVSTRKIGLMSPFRALQRELVAGEKSV